MTAPIARDPIYRRRHFEAGIIELCVRWYITYRLSYRDLVAMMAERGLAVSHTTILRWVIRYVPELEKRWSRWARDVNSSPGHLSSFGTGLSFQLDIEIRAAECPAFSCRQSTRTDSSHSATSLRQILAAQQAMRT